MSHADASAPTPARPNPGVLHRETLAVGPLQANCHILARVAPAEAGAVATPCVVIDPGSEAGRIAAFLDQRRWTPAAFFLTHAHIDHIAAVTELRARYPEAKLTASAETSRRLQDPRTNLSVLLGEAVRVAAADRRVQGGERFAAAGIDFEATEIPGHDPGELVYGVREAGWLFTGDVLFAGSVGRSDFPGGDPEALIAGVRALLDAWPEDAVVFPGHGPSTTVGEEKRGNPFLV